MFEEEERILRADGKARGTEIGNKIYGEWFATAKKHAKLNLDGGEVQMLPQFTMFGVRFPYSYLLHPIHPHCTNNTMLL